MKISNLTGRGGKATCWMSLSLFIISGLFRLFEPLWSRRAPDFVNGYIYPYVFAARGTRNTWYIDKIGVELHAISYDVTAASAIYFVIVGTLIIRQSKIERSAPR